MKNGDKYFLILDENDSSSKTATNYNKLYVPYDVFKSACRQIKAVYTGAGQEHGYANYMTYWARNGSYTDICDYSENIGSTYGTTLVVNTYLVSSFWSVYDGTKDLVTGADYDGKKAVGW